MGAYPYGGARVMFFAAPAVLLLGGAGLGPLAAWRPGGRAWGHGAAALLVLAPAGNAAFRAAVPWPRAATDGAAADVLARRGAGEGVVSNCWEGFYHFRHLDPPVAPVPASAEGLPPRVWAFVVGAEAARREEVVAHLRRGRDVLERREYRGATVLLLARPRPPS
jgi:hypothetical protein